MRIISTRKLRFYNEDHSENFVTEGKNIIQDCPDWARKDAMFQAACGAGILQVISDRAVQKVMESKAEQILPQNAHESKALLEETTEKLHMDEEVEPEVKEKKKRSKKRKSKE